MNDSEFIYISENILENIAHHIEEKDCNSLLDIEYNDGILEIEIMDNSQKYVINRNSGNKKIWFSSPISGADYFSFDKEQDKWLNDKNIELKDKLLNELNLK